MSSLLLCVHEKRNTTWLQRRQFMTEDLTTYFTIEFCDESVNLVRKCVECRPVQRVIEKPK